TDVIAGPARLAIEHDVAAADGRDRDSRAARDHPVPAAHETKAESLSAVDGGPWPDALRGQLLPRDERREPIERRLVGDPERAGSNDAENRAAKVDHDDTFTSVDRQRPRCRRSSPRKRPGDREHRERADEDE